MKCKNGHFLYSDNFEIIPLKDVTYNGMIIEYQCDECYEIGRLNIDMDDFGIWDESKRQWIVGMD